MKGTNIDTSETCKNSQEKAAKTFSGRAASVSCSYGFQHEDDVKIVKSQRKNVLHDMKLLNVCAWVIVEEKQLRFSRMHANKEDVCNDKARRRKAALW